jgi:TolA-binding protein
MRKNILVPVAIGLIILTGFAAFFFKTQNLQSQLEQSNLMTQQMQNEVKRIQDEKNKVSQENEKLRSDTVSYVALNSQLQDEKDQLQKRVQEAQKNIDTKESDLQKAKTKMEELEKAIAQEKTQGQGKLVEDKKELENKIALLEDSLTKERGLYHYNLGVSYAQSKLYDDAVDAYEKSLTFNPNNPDAHYNLAVLYENMKDDPGSAVMHYKKYLELKPDADDKEEVEAVIKKLEK